jgi:hypothetical protein
MNIYYTAKDIEALAAKGIYHLELGPNTSLTDFARETAEQLDVTLIDGLGNDSTTPVSPPAVTPRQTLVASQSYNKPRGCQSERVNRLAAVSLNAAIPDAARDPESSTPVNRLVDLMGKIIKRGD